MPMLSTNLRNIAFACAGGRGSQILEGGGGGARFLAGLRAHPVYLKCGELRDFGGGGVGRYDGGEDVAQYVFAFDMMVRRTLAGAREARSGVFRARAFDVICGG